MNLFEPSRNIRYGSFGYVRSKTVARDLYGKLFGVPNLLKRLQALDIITALDIQPTDRVLDMGCGTGYITVEMAKIAAEAHGIDAAEHVPTLQIPHFLCGRLMYTRGSGTNLPFADRQFDKVLASEVLPMLPEPSIFLKEIRRVIKPGGRLVVVNGLGHPIIHQAFERNSIGMRFLKWRYAERMPVSYDDYVLRLQRSFGTAVDRFITGQEIERLIQEHGFQIERISGTPKRIAEAFISWNQFLLYLRTGRSFPLGGFIWKHLFLQMLSAFDGRLSSSGFLCVARARDA